MSQRIVPYMLLLLLGLASVGGCGPWMTEGDYYYVRRNGAELPVWVRGNIDSGVFIVTLHGGPGHAGHEFVTSKGFPMLEDDYAVVYWDQRASGMSQGNPSPDTFTVDEFVADTDAVVSVVREIYGFDEFFLLGHSWGGDLGIAYMVDGEQRDLVAGFIPYAGAHEEVFAAQESRTWVMQRIDETIADDIDADYWREVQEIYEAHPVIQPSTPWHYLYAGALGAYYYDESTYEPPNKVELAFNSPFSMSYFQNMSRSLRLSQALLDDFDYRDRMHEITTPSLVLGGERDGVVTVSVTEELHALLGTPETDKSLVIFPGVAHSCHDEDPQRFVGEVSQFVERYR